MTVAAQIRKYIQDNLLYGNSAPLGESDSLLEAGIIDSTGAMELVAFLEEEFGIRVDDRDLVPENLDSIAAMDAFVSRKLQEQKGSPSPLAKSA